MDLTHVFFTRESKVLSFNNGSIDVLTLDLSHPFFILDAQVFADELRIDSDDLNEFVPQLEHLATD